MRPPDLPPADRYAHGTRSRYVSGCRCVDCKASNAAYYHVVQARAKAAAAEISASSTPVVKEWTAPDGKKRARTYARACPGVHGEACPTRSHLRNDSTGGVCCHCRPRLIWDGLVDAAPAREHMRKLTKQQVGRRAIRDASGVSETNLQDIRRGEKTKIRRSTLERILAIDGGARADASLVPAGPTWKLLDQLLERGFTRSALARALGRTGPTPALQLRRDHVLASTALAVERLHRTIGDPPPRGSRWRPRFCDCLAPEPSRLERCGKCGALLRPAGMTQAVIAAGPENTKPLHRAFGFEGGWGFDQRRSKVAAKREAAELRKLARGAA